MSSELFPPDVQVTAPQLRRRQLFILSPASASGLRAAMLLRRGARFPLAQAVQSELGATLGEVFTFTSGLYFRGKQLYAEAYGRPPQGLLAAYVITPGRGLMPLDATVREQDLRDFAAIPIDPRDPRYREPLARDVREVAAKLTPNARVVLLGSIASGKYTDILLEALGEKLCFPTSFVGRGDMSRGGLLLRCARNRAELAYSSVAGARLHGARPQRLSRPR